MENDNTMNSGNIDSLRAATLGKTSKFESVIVDIEGHQFEVRQPTIRDRMRLNALSSEKGPNGVPVVEPFKFLVWAVILNTYNPGTDTKVFQEEDFEAMMSMPSGGPLDKLGTAAVDLINISYAAKKNG